MQPTLSTSSAHPTDTFLALISGQLEKDYSTFSQKMDEVYLFVKEKSGNRWLSKKLLDDTTREKKIHKLYDLYVNAAPINELCRSGFMREVTKHDRSNVENMDYIYTIVVPNQMQKISEVPQLANHPGISFWLGELAATILDPAIAQNQQKILTTLPKGYLNILMDGRRKLGKELESSVKEGWIGRVQLEEIIDGISTEKDISEAYLKGLTREIAVAYFTYEYLKLIRLGNEWSNDFKKAILSGLTAFLTKDPRFA